MLPVNVHLTSHVVHSGFISTARSSHWEGSGRWGFCGAVGFVNLCCRGGFCCSWGVSECCGSWGISECRGGLGVIGSCGGGRRFRMNERGNDIIRAKRGLW